MCSSDLRMLLRHLSQVLRGGPATEEHLVVLFIDLDRFKQINDIHGHKAGDQVLRTVAGHLRSIARATDVVGRISGDEFLMITSLSEPTDSERLAARILERLEQPMQSQGISFSAGASIGIALAEPNDTPETLVDNADMAMYAAKQQGRGRLARYHRSMRERLEERHRLKAELQIGRTHV